MDRKPTTEELVHLKQKFIADWKWTEDDFKKKATELWWITQTVSDTYWTGKDNSADIKKTMLSADLSKDEKKKILNDTKSKNSQYSLDAIKNNDSTSVNQLASERNLINLKWDNDKYKWIKTSFDFHDMPESKYNETIANMDALMTSDKWDGSKWKALNRIKNDAQNHLWLVWIDIWNAQKNKNLTDEEKKYVVAELEKVRGRYKKILAEANMRQKSLWDLSWYQLIWW